MKKENILITGPSGFIGKTLISFLKEKDEFNLLEYNTKSHGSIGDPSGLKHFEEKDITHVFHLASKTFVPDSWNATNEFLQVNVMGTQNVLDFCVKKKCSLTYVSAYLYGLPETLPISESVTLKPNNPYALSKCLAEDLCQFYAKEFDVKLCIIRPFNVFGKGQDEHWLIPTIIKEVKSLEKNHVELRGLKPKRDYVYLNDVVKALWLSMAFTENNNSGYNTFNIASGRSLSVKKVFEIIRDELGSNKKVVSEDVVRKNEIMDTQADISLAKNYLKWEPQYSFEEGIKDIINNSI